VHRRSARRLFLAVAAIVIAAFWVIGEPVGKGPLLLALTRTHGIDVGDLPALLLLAWAAGLAARAVPFRRRT
jgi:hypothetical protein